MTNEERDASHKIAAPTGLDHRTVAAVFAGRKVRLSSQRAVEREARRLGYGHLLPQGADINHAAVKAA